MAHKRFWTNDSGLSHLLIVHRNFSYLTINSPRAENNCIDLEKMDINSNIFILNNLLFTEDETKTTQQRHQWFLCIIFDDILNHLFLSFISINLSFFPASSFPSENITYSSILQFSYFFMRSTNHLSPSAVCAVPISKFRTD